jgi:Protein of unknown function, DUF488
MIVDDAKLAVPVTASWYTRLPDGYCRIGISRGTPRGQRGFKMYRKLAPGPWFNSVDPVEYRQRYLAVLQQLDPEATLAELVALADGKIPALLCFEREPPDQSWCHRALVSAWFHDTLGLSVFEIGHEAAGAGWFHPKLSPVVRKGSSDAR